ncbi:hypothetical protein ACIBEF_31810 [Micromonospora sp. NPDC050795]|uniref:hypothetical protein n=1 Tax=Micromonospora sp. NPDC050795 TaxID=3364282 RepID=UPI00378EFFE9
MVDPDPLSAHTPASRGSTDYRLAYDAAFDVLRHDLGQERVRADPVLRQHAAYVLGRLDVIHEHYRHMAAVGREYVPANYIDWTLADELRVLRRLALIIHSRHLARVVLGDEWLLQRLWAYGCFPSVESMLHDARQDLATVRSGDLKLLMESWAPRQASEAADLTSRRSVPGRRHRKRPGTEQPKPTAKRTRAATSRGQGRRRGR